MDSDDIIKVYVPGDCADIICDCLADNIDDFSFMDSSDLDLLDGFDYVLITLFADGSVLIEDAFNEKDELVRPSSFMNYIHNSFEFKDIQKLFDYDEPLLIFGVEEDNCSDGEELNLYDEEDGCHGFHSTKLCSNGTGRFVQVYSSTPLDDDTMDLLLEIL